MSSTCLSATPFMNRRPQIRWFRQWKRPCALASSSSQPRGNHGVSSLTGLPGYAGILSPGNAPSAITVGSVKTLETNTRTDDRVAAYSSRGPTWYDGIAKPDLVAPGHGLVAAAAKSSTLYTDNPSLRVGDSYLRLSGTSMAAGVVSGTVALMIEANRSAFSAAPLSPNAVKAILQYTSLPVRDEQGVEYDYLTQGTGSVNTAGAIALAARIDPSMPLASWWLTSGVDEWTVIDGQIQPWAETVAWGDCAQRRPGGVLQRAGVDAEYRVGQRRRQHRLGQRDDNIVWGSATTTLSGAAATTTSSGAATSCGGTA